MPSSHDTTDAVIAARNSARTQVEGPSSVTTEEQLPTNMSAEDLDKLRQDLDFMMAHYEGELKKPIRNLVSGRLPRTLLIQVAYTEDRYQTEMPSD